MLTDADSRLVRRCAAWVLRATATGGAAFVRSPSLDPELLAALRRVERGISLAEVLALLGERVDAEFLCLAVQPLV